MCLTSRVTVGFSEWTLFHLLGVILSVLLWLQVSYCVWSPRLCSHFKLRTTVKVYRSSNLKKHWRSHLILRGFWLVDFYRRVEWVYWLSVTAMQSSTANLTHFWTVSSNTPIDILRWKRSVTEESSVFNQSARRNIPQDLNLKPAILKIWNLEHWKQCIVDTNVVPCEFCKTASWNVGVVKLLAVCCCC
jgi:hypothetical protein